MKVTTLIPAAAYYRMSSDQQEASITDQRIAVEKYAKANGYRIVAEYIDEAVSGWRDDRKSFKRLIADVPSGKFQAILCWDQDRFSRFPVLEANHYWFILDRAGVQLTTVAQGRLDFSTLTGWLTASIAQHGKSEYCRDLARNTTRGLRKRKLAGDWVGSAPLGYRLESGRLALGNPQDIGTVRTIFAMRSQGHGLVAILKHLNSSGIPTPRGKRWSQFTIKHVLRRDAYLGKVVIGKHSRAKYERLTDGIVTIDNTHPAIISQELWDKCRVVDKQLTKAHSRNNSEGAPLSGLLVCGCCGAPMYAVKFDKWPYYICGSYHMRGECGRCAIPQERLNRLLVEKLRERVCGADAKLIEAAIEKLLKESSVPAIDQAAIAKQLAAIDQKIENATDRLVSVNTALVPSIEAKLVELHRQREALAAQSTPVAPPQKLLAKNILKELQGIDAILTHGNAAEMRHTFTTFIKHIRIDFKHTETTKSGMRRFRPTGAEILFLSKDGLHSERLSAFCYLSSVLFPAKIKLSAKDLAA